MYLDDYDDEDIESLDSGWDRFWAKLHPGLKSAALLWAVSLGMGVLHGTTAGVSLLLCYPVQLLFYVANGFLAGYFAINREYRVSDLPRIGAIAGFFLWILPAVMYLIFGLILGIATLGVGFVGAVSWLVCGPVELAVQMAAGALGGWLYGRIANVEEDEYY